MLKCNNREEQTMQERFLANWKDSANDLRSKLSVDMAWTILLVHTNKRKAPANSTFSHYYNNYYGHVLQLYRK